MLGEVVTLKWRLSFLETLRSIESSSSGVALAAGEMLAPALAEATAVADTAGVGDWPNAVRASAIEPRQLKIVVFIGIFRSEMRSGAALDSRKTRRATLSLGSAGCQPAVPGSLPRTLRHRMILARRCYRCGAHTAVRQAAGRSRLAACAPQTKTLHRVSRWPLFFPAPNAGV